MPTTEERLVHYRTVLDQAASERAPDSTIHVDAAPVRPRRLLWPVAAGLMLVAGIGGSLVVANDRDSVPPNADAPATSPIGTWRAAADPPFPMKAGMNATTTDDGRVVVLGPTPHSEIAAFEGGIYDPVADVWTVIPPAPLTDGATFALAGGIAIAVSEETQSGVGAAWLDLETLQWTAIEVPVDVGTSVYPWSFDGETLVFIDAGETVGTAPTTLRWSLGDPTWRAGVPFPLAARQFPATASDDRRIAVWGGASGGDPSAAVTDGAIYDITDDSWSIIPADPALLEISRSRPAALLHGSSLFLVGGWVDGSPRQAMSTDGTAWRRLPSPSAAGLMVDGTMAATVAIDATMAAESHRVEYLLPTDGVWRDAPYRTLVATPGGLLALSATPDNPGAGPFQASILDAGLWQAVSDAPFVNRMEPAVAVVGDLVLIVGGDQGPDLIRQQDAWILDLSH